MSLFNQKKIAKYKSMEPDSETYFAKANQPVEKSNFEAEWKAHKIWFLKFGLYNPDPGKCDSCHKA